MTTIVTLVPEQLWQAIQPCSPPHHPATAAGPVSMTALRWPASSISCAPASPGGCCPLASSAVVAGHLLAAAVRLATRRRLAASAPGAVGPARPRWPARLVPRQRGFSERACQTGGELTGPNPTDRGKPGSKYHLLVDRRGIPLAACLSAANTHDEVVPLAVELGWRPDG